VDVGEDRQAGRLPDLREDLQAALEAGERLALSYDDL
jgi:hypothetical protein